jgi:hypothetical protein
MPKPIRRCQHCCRVLPPLMRSDARFCSAACRAKERRHRPRMDHIYAREPLFGGRGRRCQQCGGPLIGLDDRREDARYCSAACRQRAYRARRHQPRS